MANLAVRFAEALSRIYTHKPLSLPRYIRDIPSVRILIYTHARCNKGRFARPRNGRLIDEGHSMMQDAALTSDSDDDGSAPSPPAKRRQKRPATRPRGGADTDDSSDFMVRTVIRAGTRAPRSRPDAIAVFSSNHHVGMYFLLRAFPTLTAGHAATGS